MKLSKFLTVRQILWIDIIKDGGKNSENIAVSIDFTDIAAQLVD